jgi:two-component system, NarL family, invasion response regulator UvrY
MNILVADDHPMIQKGLKMLLKDIDARIQIASVFNGSDIFDTLDVGAYDLLLLDINMPDMSFQVFERIRSKYPDLRILIYSQNPEEQHAVRYLKAGAFGYLEKKTSDEEVSNAIRQIMMGKKYYSSIVLDSVVSHLRGEAKHNPFETLSNREYDVALALIKGINVSEICNQFKLSPSTVSTYKSRLFEKLNISNMAELFVLGREYNLL